MFKSKKMIENDWKLKIPSYVSYNLFELLLVYSDIHQEIDNNLKLK